MTQQRKDRAMVHAAAIMAHAYDNYDVDGWDVVVECWEIADIAAFLVEHKITNFVEALGHFRLTAEYWEEGQRNAAE